MRLIRDRLREASLRRSPLSRDGEHGAGSSLAAEETAAQHFADEEDAVLAGAPGGGVDPQALAGQGGHVEEVAARAEEEEEHQIRTHVGGR